MPNYHDSGLPLGALVAPILFIALLYPTCLPEAQGDARQRWQFAETWPIETGDGPQMELIRWEGSCFLLINGRRANGPFLPHRCPLGLPAEPYDPFQETP